MAHSKVDERTKAILKKLGAKIRAARQAAGLSQQQLAEAISMDRENYAKIERASINVTIDTLVRIAHGIGVRLEVDFVAPPSRRSSGGE
ncbi:MAG: helix-turn-helix transcriptional regulator [Deltaproteobacteria bacterium]|nr:helix-turn-helix transcriptional regulator [Deltaproteobacteria bacterium]